jgi:hypothetical protein
MTVAAPVHDLFSFLLLPLCHSWGMILVPIIQDGSICIPESKMDDEERGTTISYKRVPKITTGYSAYVITARS